MGAFGVPGLLVFGVWEGEEGKEEVCDFGVKRSREVIEKEGMMAKRGKIGLKSGTMRMKC